MSAARFQAGVAPALAPREAPGPERLLWATQAPFRYAVHFSELAEQGLATLPAATALQVRERLCRKLEDAASLAELRQWAEDGGGVLPLSVRGYEVRYSCDRRARRIVVHHLERVPARGLSR